MLKLIRYPACTACLLLFLCISQSFTGVAAENKISTPVYISGLFKIINPLKNISKYDEWNLSATGTYTGDNRNSLKLKGCEKGYNDKALERNIILKGASYINNEFILQNGFLGRSYGCPSVPLYLSNKIISNLKNGACLFIYHPNKNI